MTDAVPLARSEVLELLTGFGGRGPDQIPERLGSMEFAWLLHQVEQRYGVPLDLDDERLAEVRTVTDAARVLGEIVAEHAR